MVECRGLAMSRRGEWNAPHEGGGRSHVEKKNLLECVHGKSVSSGWLAWRRLASGWWRSPRQRLRPPAWAPPAWNSENLPRTAAACCAAAQSASIRPPQLSYVLPATFSLRLHPRCLRHPPANSPMLWLETGTDHLASQPATPDYRNVSWMARLAARTRITPAASITAYISHLSLKNIYSF